METSRSNKLSIVGATGLVGNEIIALLDSREHWFSEIELFASKDSEGEVYKIGQNEVSVQALSEQSFSGSKVVIFCARQDVVRQYVDIAKSQGAVVIDCSGAFYDDPEYLVAVPEVNADAINSTTKSLASACPASVPLARVLKIVQDLAGLKYVSVTSLHSTSGAGKAALDELWQQTIAICNQSSVETEEFEHQIAFNCIPQVDVMSENGSSKEENRILKELGTVLRLDNLEMDITCVRIPTLYGYAQCVSVICDKSISPKDLTDKLSLQTDISTYQDSHSFPMPLMVGGSEEIHVGRIRQNKNGSSRISFWVVSDNIRRGAALNAIRIAELVGKEYNQ